LAKVHSNGSAAIYSTDTPATATLKPFTLPVPATGGTVTVDSSGQGQQASMSNIAVSGELSTLQPYLTLNYIICVQGVYPSRQ
jgi:microcystin-dependent protein